MAALLEVERLEKVYLTHRGEEVKAVQDLSFEIRPGEIYGLLGPNGAGKTTTLRILAGLLTPDQGRIVMDGQVVADMATGVHHPMRLKEKVGFLTAQTGLYGRLTPLEHLLYFAALRGMEPQAARSSADKLIALLGMGAFANRRCEGLSTGQRQRVQIARTLLGDPPLLILDEPTLGLDVLSNQLILQFIRDASRGGRAVLLSTHHLDDVQDLGDRFGLLHKGALLAEGSLHSLQLFSGKNSLSRLFRDLVFRADPEILSELTWSPEKT